MNRYDEDDDTLMDVFGMPTSSSNPYVNAVVKDYRIGRLSELQDAVLEYRSSGTAFSTHLIDTTWASEMIIENTIKFLRKSTTYLLHYNLGRCSRITWSCPGEGKKSAISVAARHSNVLTAYRYCNPYGRRDDTHRSRDIFKARERMRAAMVELTAMKHMVLDLRQEAQQALREQRPSKMSTAPCAKNTLNINYEYD